MDQFRDLHRGQTCYLFGDGVSLKWFQLDAFPPLPSFALSYLFFHKDIATLRPTYGMLTEPYYFYPYFRLPWPPRTLWRNRIQLQYRRFIDRWSTTSFFVNLSNYPVLRRDNVHYLFRSIPGSRFCTDCETEGQECFHGSLRAAITVAIHMGFTDIYLVGCDYTHFPGRTRHWYEKGEGAIREFPVHNREFLNIAERYAKLTTVTLDGTSHMLPHVTYEELTGKKPRFRENTDLVELEHLELLDTWPDYQIF